MPDKELELFRRLKDIKVVFDVGARTDTDYLDVDPDIELHIFEPNPKFFDELLDKCADNYKCKYTTLNEYGLGDSEGYFAYSDGIQGFSGGDAFSGQGHRLLQVRTLDNYVREKKIKRIDFLKTDTEGYDYKVLQGGKNTLGIIKYLQWEGWDDNKKFYDLLEKNFSMIDVGYRNTLCINRAIVKPNEVKNLRRFIKRNKFADLE